jgi:hypothetical protein
MPRDREFDELVYLRNENRRLRELLNAHTSPLEVLLRRRGFRVFSKNPREDLLLPSDESIDTYYRMLHRYSFRLFLRDVIKHQNFFNTENVARYAAADVTADYLRYLLSLGIIAETEGGFHLTGRRVRSFGETLEWYVAEILRREFSFETIWGAKFKRPRIGGDYDVLGRLNGSVLYIEVKSSPPKQVYPGEVSAFLGRVSDLLPEVAVFFMDTELRMKDKIVPLFEDELKKQYAAPPEVTRIEKELFQIENRIFIINAKDNVISNIERVLDRYFRK